MGIRGGSRRGYQCVNFGGPEADGAAEANRRQAPIAYQAVQHVARQPKAGAGFRKGQQLVHGVVSLSRSDRNAKGPHATRTTWVKGAGPGRVFRYQEWAVFLCAWMRTDVRL